MGEARQRQYSRKQFLSIHPRCVYCGEPATTTDHCPPRCFFKQRQWPETFEFPACHECNQEARLDEQALAVLIRMRLGDNKDKSELEELKRLINGVKNNQKELINEWESTTTSIKKNIFKEAFGPRLGYLFWHYGYGAINEGPLTNEIINRFMVKLGKSLYYKHINNIFEGDIYAAHINAILEKEHDRITDKILSFLPELEIPQRNNRSFKDEFQYRYSYNEIDGIFGSCIYFNPQFIFNIFALSPQIAARIATNTPESQNSRLTRFPCSLQNQNSRKTGQ